MYNITNSFETGCTILNYTITISLELPDIECVENYVSPLIVTLNNNLFFTKCEEKYSN